MSGCNVGSSAQRPVLRSPAQVGFTLVELMIAMVLGILVMGAAFAVFVSNQNTFRANEGLNRIQESARTSFEMLSRDIRAAGGSACSNASVVESTGAQSTAFRDDPITGSANSLTVVSGDDTSYPIASSTAASVVLDSDETDAAENAFSANDWLLLCNARKTYLIQANTVSGNQVTFDPLPGGYSPFDDELGPPASVVIARFRDVRWFVGANSRGGSSLFVSRMGGAQEEVAEGVQAIDFSYLQEGGTAFQATANLDTVAVRVNMTLVGQNVDGQALTRTASSVISLRGRTL